MWSDTVECHCVNTRETFECQGWHCVNVWWILSNSRSAIVWISDQSPDTLAPYLKMEDMSGLVMLMTSPYLPPTNSVWSFSRELFCEYLVFPYQLEMLEFEIQRRLKQTSNIYRSPWLHATSRHWGVMDSRALNWLWRVQTLIRHSRMTEHQCQNFSVFWGVFRACWPSQTKIKNSGSTISNDQGFGNFAKIWLKSVGQLRIIFADKK